MKDYKNVAEDVFRRSGEMIEQRKIRRKKLVGIGVSAACWAAAGAVGFGVWKTSGLHLPDTVISAGQFANDGKDHSGESDVVLVDPAQGGNDPMPGGVTEPVNGQNGSGDPETSRPASFNGFGNDIINQRQVWRTLIENFEVDSDEKYAAPENGQVIYSIPLREAMNTYGYTDEGGEISYRVVIEYYKDGKCIEPTKELWESERGRFGNGFGFLTNSNLNSGSSRSYICHDMATKKELENFEPSGEYGYVIFLYGEYFGEKSEPRTGDGFIRSGGVKFIGFDSDEVHDTINDIDIDKSGIRCAPENGNVGFSIDLQKAIEVYGNDDVNYNVVIQYYKDGNYIDSTPELWEEEHDRNPNVYLIESIDTRRGNYHIGMCGSRDLLEGFTPNEKYGCAIFLHNVYFRNSEISEIG